MVSCNRLFDLSCDWDVLCLVSRGKLISIFNAMKEIENKFLHKIELHSPYIAFGV